MSDPLTTCFLCDQAIEHAQVVMVGLDTKEVTIRVHPQCLGSDKDKLIKQLFHVEVHAEPGRTISPAKQIVVKKRVKEIYKALAIANEMKRRQEAGK